MNELDRNLAPVIFSRLWASIASISIQKISHLKHVKDAFYERSRICISGLNKTTQEHEN